MYRAIRWRGFSHSETPGWAYHVHTLVGSVSNEVSDAPWNSWIYGSPVIKGNDMPFGGDVRHGEGEDSKNPIQHIHDREIRWRSCQRFRGSRVRPSQHRCQVFIPFDPEESGQLKRPRAAWISISSSLTFPRGKVHDHMQRALLPMTSVPFSSARCALTSGCQIPKQGVGARARK